jgi:hypothetical protein
MNGSHPTSNEFPNKTSIATSFFQEIPFGRWWGQRTGTPLFIRWARNIRQRRRKEDLFNEMLNVVREMLNVVRHVVAIHDDAPDRSPVEPRSIRSGAS